MAKNPIKPNPITYTKEKYMYDTLAEAQADTSLQAGDMVKTYGKLEKNDGLGKTYEVVSVGYLKEIPQYGLEVKSVRVTQTTSIKDFIKEQPIGIYSSSRVGNLWTDLPEDNGSEFTLIITGNANQRTGTYIETAMNARTYQISYGYYSTNPNDRWSKWKKIVYDIDDVMQDRKTVSTKEEADSLFNTMTNITTGYTFIDSFDTVFANTTGIKPTLQYGFLYTYVYRSNNQKSVYQIFIGFAGDGQYNVSRRGVVQANGIDIVYSDWKIENQQIVNGNSGTNVWIKFADGTLIQHMSHLDISTYTNGTRISFPVTFTQIPSVSVSDNSNAQNAQIQISPSLSDFAFYNIEQRQSHLVSVIAIGRWK
jgi:hypothetical protein